MNTLRDHSWLRRGWIFVLWVYEIRLWIKEWRADINPISKGIDPGCDNLTADFKHNCSQLALGSDGSGGVSFLFKLPSTIC